LNGYE